MTTLNSSAAKPVSPGTSPSTISAIRTWKAAFGEIGKRTISAYTDWEGEEAVKNLKRAGLLDVAAHRRVNNVYWEERGRKDIIKQLIRLVQQYLKFHGTITQRNQEFRDKTEHLDEIYNWLKRQARKCNSYPNVKKNLLKASRSCKLQREELKRQHKLPWRNRGGFLQIVQNEPKYRKIPQRNLDLDSRLQIRVAALFRSILPKSDGVSLRTISRLVVLFYVCIGFVEYRPDS